MISAAIAFAAALAGWLLACAAALAQGQPLPPRPVYGGAEADALEQALDAPADVQREDPLAYPERVSDAERRQAALEISGHQMRLAARRQLSGERQDPVWTTPEERRWLRCLSEAELAVVARATDEDIQNLREAPPAGVPRLSLTTCMRRDQARAEALAEIGAEPEPDEDYVMELKPYRAL